MPNTDLIGAAEACELLDINRATLHEWVKAGKITPALTGRGRTGARFFSSADIDALRSDLLAQAQAKVERLKSSETAA